MSKNDNPTKGLAIAGTAMVWLCVLSPVIVAAMRFPARGFIRFDYLLPAELFPVALLGGGLVLWAAVRARSRRRLIGWSLGVAAGLLAAGQALAVATGLASGAAEPVGWPWALVVASIAGYTLALVALGIGGVLLLRDLFKATP